MPTLMPRPTPIPNRPSRPELVVIRSEPGPRRGNAAVANTDPSEPTSTLTSTVTSTLTGRLAGATAGVKRDMPLAGSPPHAAIDSAAINGAAINNAATSNATMSDAALVEAARAGHMWAQEALFHRHSRMVLGLSQRILAGRDDAEDLAQDAFIYALGRLDTLNNPQAFSSWLGSIVVRTASKRLRRQRLMVRLGLRRNEPIDPNTLVSRTAPSDVGAELRVVYSLLNNMPAEQRVALVLRRVEGMELKEIAEHMGLSLATVKRRLSDAEGRLDRAMLRL